MGQDVDRLEHRSMKGKRLLVAGGSSGIGGALAEELIAAGHCVGILSRRSVCSWDWRVPKNWNADANLLRVDLRQLAHVREICAGWASDGLDGLVFSAVEYGGSRRQSILDVSLASWQSVIETNVLGFAAVVTSVLPALLRARPGVLVNISSETAANPAPGRAPYGASKAVQRHILRSLVEEIAPNSLSIIEMLPEGMVRTPGIERRRPVGTDWSSYASPRSFCRFMRELLELDTPIVGYRAFVVSPDGRVRPSNGNDVASQTAPVGIAP